MRLMPTLAKSDFGQNWCFSLEAFFYKKRTEQQEKRVGPRVPAKWGPEGWGPEGWRLPKFRAVFPSPASMFALFLSLWVSSRGILVVFEVVGPEMCTFEVLGRTNNNQNHNNTNTARSGVEDKPRTSVAPKGWWEGGEGGRRVGSRRVAPKGLAPSVVADWPIQFRPIKFWPANFGQY